MKMTSVTSPDACALVVARMCAENLDSKAVEYYLKTSPSPRDFKNRLAAARFRASTNAFLTSTNSSDPKDTLELAADFDLARNNHEAINEHLDTWLSIIEHWCHKIAGIKWETQRKTAAKVATEVIEAGRELARCQAALSFGHAKPLQ
ncbi:MAG: hypothetical protein JWN94_2625 [Betaproteobacteria bacterium]|nr:hypothetical protein [Betaproteobacteria bacterium]